MWCFKDSRYSSTLMFPPLNLCFSYSWRLLVQTLFHPFGCLNFLDYFDMLKVHVGGVAFPPLSSSENECQHAPLWRHLSSCLTGLELCTTGLLTAYGEHLSSYYKLQVAIYYKLKVASCILQTTSTYIKVGVDHMGIDFAIRIISNKPCINIIICTPSKVRSK